MAINLYQKCTRHLRQGAHHLFGFFFLTAAGVAGCDVLETGIVTALAFTTLTALGLDCGGGMSARVEAQPDMAKAMMKMRARCFIAAPYRLMIEAMDWTK